MAREDLKKLSDDELKARLEALSPVSAVGEPSKAKGSSLADDEAYVGSLSDYNLFDIPYKAGVDLAQGQKDDKMPEWLNDTIAGGQMVGENVLHFLDRIKTPLAVAGGIAAGGYGLKKLGNRPINVNMATPPTGPDIPKPQTPYPDPSVGSSYGQLYRDLHQDKSLTPEQRQKVYDKIYERQSNGSFKGEPFTGTYEDVKSQAVPPPKQRDPSKTRTPLLDERFKVAESLEANAPKTPTVSFEEDQRRYKIFEAEAQAQTKRDIEFKNNLANAESARLAKYNPAVERLRAEARPPITPSPGVKQGGFARVGALGGVANLALLATQLPSVARGIEDFRNNPQNYNMTNPSVIDRTFPDTGLGPTPIPKPTKVKSGLSAADQRFLDSLVNGRIR